MTIGAQKSRVECAGEFSRSAPGKLPFAKEGRIAWARVDCIRPGVLLTVTEMAHNQEQVLEYWNDHSVESMCDKNLLHAEIELIRQFIPQKAKILDAGCGEGEGTLVYSSDLSSEVHAVDFSETRLRKARERLSARGNVVVKQVDFLANYELDSDYDAIVSQRFLINLMEWTLQQKVLLDLMSMLKPRGRLLMLEGSCQGVESLNEFRAALGLNPIPVRWHNLFFDDDALVSSMSQHGYKLIEHRGLGSYFLLTRGIRPALPPE